MEGIFPIPILNNHFLTEKFMTGVKHYVIRHKIKNMDNRFESTFDMLSNPYTGDIEAIAVLHDITEKLRADDIINTLMKIDYDSITTIDAMTGEASPFVKSQIDDVIDMQKKIKDNVRGVESYLRKHCVDNDIERVIKETSLPYVKKRLEEVPIHNVTYTIKINGKIIHKRVIYTYLNSDKHAILCAMQDITDTYKQEALQKKTLEIALNDAEKANRAKTDFFSRMSHDMRTPMNGILGLAELSENIEDVGELQKNMSKIKESGKYLLSLINDTLDFQRIESGRLKLDKKYVKAQVLLDNIVDIINSAARIKDIDFVIDSHDVDMNWCIYNDPVRLKQIFINLLSNAVKFTPEGGKVVLDIRCMSREGRIAHNCLSVIDTGIGMSEDFLNNSLFQPYTQEHNSVSDEYAGSGLGLSIVQSLVQMMGGRIDVKSKLGEGTTFSVYLDFERVDYQQAVIEVEKTSKQKRIQRHSLEGKKILLAEDHPLNAEIAKKLLNKMGCKVLWVENGEKCLSVFKESAINEYDVILMDIRMPVMNGLEAATKIRELKRSDAGIIPIIAMTANAYEEDVKKSLTAGMNCHLAKPIEPTNLFETLIKYIQGE